jgi:tripartite-type tricarboxylate transporter receptor subunit TctC
MKSIRLFAGLVLALSAALAHAQSYPNRSVRVIVPYPAGGTVDAVARVVAQRLSEQMGQSFIVDNRAGANGVIGSDAVAKAQADGYTLLVQASTFVTNPILLKNLPYDMMRDFAPISNIGSVPLVVTTYPTFPASNLKEFIALVLASPEKYAFAAPPTGSAGHLAEEAIKAGAKLGLQIVPYKGTAPAMTDVMGGHASALIDALPSSYPQVKGGKLKALAVTSPKRIAFLPNVPTVAESGLPGFDMVSWYGLWGPAALPKELGKRLSGEVAKAVRSQLAVERLGDQGFDAVGSTPEEFAVFLEQELVKYTRIVKQANVKVE